MIVMFWRSFTSFIILLVLAASASGKTSVTNVISLNALKGNATVCTGAFQLVGQLTYQIWDTEAFAIDDGTGRTVVFLDKNSTCKAGDVVNITKGIYQGSDYFAALDYNVTASRPLPPPVSVKISELRKPSYALSIT